MEVQSIIIYPIKGMQGVPVDKARCLPRGLEHDRRYMLVDEKGTFLSQRTHVDLIHFAPTIQDNHIIIRHEDDVVEESIHTVSTAKMMTYLFEHSFYSHLVSEKLDEWFSERLGQKVHLVRITEDHTRTKKLIKGPEETPVSFADGYPYLIAGTASLALLNEKLDQPIDMNRFRPNIVVNTSIPHEEDNWDIIHIGHEKMQIIKPCARCPVVTIDQSTGTKSKEPLRTLATYRKDKNKVNFGANAISLTQRQICVGDTVSPR